LFVFFVVRFDVLNAIFFVVVEFVNIVNISVVVFIGSDFFDDAILGIKFVFDSNSGVIAVAEFDKGSEWDVFNVVGVDIDVVESFFVGDKVVGVERDVFYESVKFVSIGEDFDFFGKAVLVEVFNFVWLSFVVNKSGYGFDFCGFA
jgi:hypothetical protein